jgi:hypothetical protein
MVSAVRIRFGGEANETQMTVKPFMYSTECMPSPLQSNVTSQFIFRKIFKQSPYFVFISLLYTFEEIVKERQYHGFNLEIGCKTMPSS